MQIDRLYLGFLKALKRTKEEFGKKSVVIKDTGMKELDLGGAIEDAETGMVSISRNSYLNLYFDGAEIRIYERDNLNRNHPLKICVFFNYDIGNITNNPGFYSKLAQNAEIPLTIEDRHGTVIRSNYENRRSS